MTNNLRGLSRVALASKVLADAAREEGIAAREMLTEAMADGGIERVRVTGGDGGDYGTVVLAAGRRTAGIVDEAAFMAWVAERYPQEITQQVRPLFRDRLLAGATRRGDPVDASTGEVIPGVEIRQGDPYLVTKPSASAKDRMKTALAAHGLLMLGTAEAGDGS